MISYTIAMTFISWAIAILMLIGFGLLKLWEHDSKNSNDMVIQEYYESNFAGKVTKLLFFGAFFFAILISMARGDFKDE